MALSRPGKLGVLALAALGLIGVLVFNVRESRTIVVATQPNPGSVASGTMVGALVAPRYNGVATNGTTWSLSAARADQIASGSGPSLNAATAEISLTTLTALLEQPNQAPLNLWAGSARYQPQSTKLALPNGVAISGTVGGYGMVLKAGQAQANLTSSTLAFTGGVSATLWPR